MTFFKPLTSELPIVAQLPYTDPIWTGPSDHACGTIIPTNVVLALGDDVALLLPYGQAFRNGFMLMVDIRRRHQQDVALKPLDPVMPWEFPTEPPLRIGFEFADGRVAGDTIESPLAVPRDEIGLPYLPILSVERWHSTSHALQLQVWGWPLPPDGPLLVHCEWLREGITEFSLELDGGEFRRAGEGSSVLWPT